MALVLPAAMTDAPFRVPRLPRGRAQVGALTGSVFAALAADRAHHVTARAFLLHLWAFVIAAGDAARSAFAAAARELSAAVAARNGAATAQQRRALLLTWARDDSVPATMRALCAVLACRACAADGSACGGAAAQHDVLAAFTGICPRWNGPWMRRAGDPPFAQEVRDAAATACAARRCACTRALRKAMPRPTPLCTPLCTRPRPPHPLLDGALRAVSVQHAPCGGRTLVAARLRLPQASAPLCGGAGPDGAHCTPYSADGWALSLWRTAAASHHARTQPLAPPGEACTLAVTLHCRARRGAARAFSAAVQFGIAAPSDTAAAAPAEALQAWLATGRLAVPGSVAQARAYACPVAGVAAGGAVAAAPPWRVPRSSAAPQCCGRLCSKRRRTSPCRALCDAARTAAQLALLSAPPFLAAPPYAANAAAREGRPLSARALATPPETHARLQEALRAAQQPRARAARWLSPDAAADGPQPPFIVIGDPRKAVAAAVNVRVADGGTQRVAQCAGDERGPRALGHRMRAGDEVLLFALVTTCGGDACGAP